MSCRISQKISQSADFILTTILPVYIRIHTINLDVLASLDLSFLSLSIFLCS